jgi:hypothetical protein
MSIMTPTTETEIRELRDLILGLREETRVGFAELKGEIQRVEANTEAKFAELKGEIKKSEAELKGDIQKIEANTDVKFAEVRGDLKVLEERTKLGFWGFVWRSVVIAVLVSLLSVANKFVFGGGLGSLGM